MNPKWLEWTRQLQAIAQDGLTFAKDPFDIERYHQIRRLAAEIGAECTGGDTEAILGLFERERGYATPKVDGRGVVFDDDKILLVREKSDGLWTLPGGWVDVGEPPSESVEREVWEESGYQVRAVRLLALLDRDKHPHPPLPDHTYKIFLLCELTGGEPTESLETDGVGFFTEDAIPELSLTRNTPGQIARLFEHHRDPNLPADFD